jgi:hypothetical protein
MSAPSSGPGFPRLAEGFWPLYQLRDHLGKREISITSDEAKCELG